LHASKNSIWPFRSSVFAPAAALQMPELVDIATEIELQLTCFVDDLTHLFNSRQDMEKDLLLLQEINKFAGFRKKPLKSVYSPINCKNPLYVIVNSVAITPAIKRKKKFLLGSFFSPALGIHNSLHQATTIL
jgi:hypothetical protein